MELEHLKAFQTILACTLPTLGLGQEVSIKKHLILHEFQAKEIGFSVLKPKVSGYCTDPMWQTQDPIV